MNETRAGLPNDVVNLVKLDMVKQGTLRELQAYVFKLRKFINHDSKKYSNRQKILEKQIQRNRAQLVSLEASASRSEDSSHLNGKVP